MKYRPILIALAALVPLCASCVKSDDPALRRQIAAERLLKRHHRIKIAVAGPWAQKRNLLLEGLELARDELNASGGVLGAQIEIVPFDDNSNRDTGGRAAYQIANDEEICAVIGHSASSVSVSNSLIYHYYGLLMFSPLSTSRGLTQQGLPLVFRNIPDDDTIGTQAAQFCEKSSWRRVMIYYLNNSYGEGLANAFELQCGENGIAIPDRASYESVYGVRDYSELAKSWKENYSFDAVFIAGSMPQAGEIVSIFRANGISEPIIGGDAFDVPMFFHIAGNDEEEAVYTVTNFDGESENPAFASFRTAFIARYGHELDQAAFQGYDALMVLAKAMEAARSVRGADIAAALKEAELWNEAAGPYRFDEKGNVAGRTLCVKKTDGGAFRAVEQ